MDIIKHYVEIFNREDNELYKSDIDNAHAYEWLKEEIPVFSCPNKDIERAYYFRFWTYRKHIKRTDEGYVVTEFLPNVNWAGRYNTINAAFGHHLYEGRWLKNSGKYLSDYTRFFLNHSESAHSYSTWFSDAVMKLISVTGDLALAEELLPGLCKYYKVWEDTHKLKNGMFYSFDGRDAMEFSISGRNKELSSIPGIRPTLNSYMCADCFAIAKLASLLGKTKIEREYRKKYGDLRSLINKRLYKDGFYRAFHHSDMEKLNYIFDDADYMPPRELLGYIPWMFNIPTGERTECFDLLLQDSAFYTDYGLATAERSHPDFLYDANHDCLWNGYIWPFATSQTLYALQNAIDNYGVEKHKETYIKLLLQYAKSHTRILEDGRKISWIDESRSALRDEWYTRAQRESKGYTDIPERGKDYNHSTFCDLVITGIVGVKASLFGGIKISPNIPSDWDYFSLSGLHFKGKRYDISYKRESGIEIRENP